MNNEIKETLKILKKCEIGACITKHNSRVLLDYITNLQQENERLKYQLRVQEDLTVKNRMRKHIYKSRCEKAIEYYKMHQQECVIGRNRDDKLIKDYYLPAQHSKVLLNILQNGGEENDK